MRPPYDGFLALFYLFDRPRELFHDPWTKKADWKKIKAVSLVYNLFSSLPLNTKEKKLDGEKIVLTQYKEARSDELKVVILSLSFSMS